MRRSRAGATTAMTLLLAARNMRPASYLAYIGNFSRYFSSAHEIMRLALIKHPYSFSCRPGAQLVARHLCSSIGDTRSLAMAASLRGEGAHGGQLTTLLGKGGGNDGAAGEVNTNSSSRIERSSSAPSSGGGARPNAGSTKRPTGIRRLGTATGPSGGRASWGGTTRGTGAGREAPYGAGRVGAVRRMHDGDSTERFDGKIPEDRLRIAFTRSSGAGGQNVNKVSTKVELRFVIQDADWLPSDVRIRLSRRESGRVNKDGELVVTSQEFRTQAQNRTNALRKLKTMIEESWDPPKERRMRTGISKTGKAIRRADKEFRSQVKANRSKIKDF